MKNVLEVLTKIEIQGFVCVGVKETGWQMEQTKQIGTRCHRKLWESKKKKNPCISSLQLVLQRNVFLN